MIGDSEGDGPIHRLPPTAKLVALVVFSIAVFAVSSPWILAAMAAITLGLALLFCRQALVQWLRAWILLFTIIVVVAWNAVAIGGEAALVTFFRLGSLSLFAAMVTATTSVGAFIDTITKLLRPLERLGLANARDVGLAIGLVIRFIPEVQVRYRAVADAHRARGLNLKPSTVIVPLIIGTVLSADEIANAIDARNIRDNSTD